MENNLSAKCNEPVNLLVTIDNNYIEPLTVMMNAYSEAHIGVDTHLFIAHSSLTECDFKRIRNGIKSAEITIHNVHITAQWFKGTPVIDRLPEESFYRLMAFEFLPDTVHRCLYLDPDIIIRKSLLPFYGMELGSFYLAASSHTYKAKNKFNLLRLNLTDNERYINSGVMLMNLDAIRKDFTVELILERLNESIQLLWLGDQDLINILFGSNALLVDEKLWNLDERTFNHNKKSFTMADVEENTAIIHYNGKHKPWLNGYKGKLDCFYPQVESKGPPPKGRWKAQLKAIRRITSLNKTQKIYCAGLLLVAVTCIICWLVFGKRLLTIIEQPDTFRAWLDKFGAFDEIVFILIRAAQTVVKFIPAEPLEIGSGYAWGAIPGMLYCVIGNMLGTLVIWALTKRLGKRFVDSFIPTSNFKTLSLFKSSEKVYALLFFLYLIPGSPKDGFTYLVGLLDVKLVPFLVITFIARMPSVLSSTLCGSTLAEKQYLISAVIFAATVVLAVLGGALYKAYTKKKLREANETKLSA